MKLVSNLYLLFIMVVSMEGSMYYRTPVMAVVRVALAGMLMLLFRIKPTRQLAKVLVVWILFVFASAAVSGDFKPSAIVFMTMRFVEAFVLLNLFKDKIFTSYVNWMLVLAFISLVGWMLSVIDLNGLFVMLRPFDFSGGFREQLGDYLHIGVFTLHDRVGHYTNYIPRNSGFCWEPGPFSILLTVAIMIHWSLMKKSKVSPVSLILLAALATTFSTTGYLIFFGYVVYDYWSRAKKLIYLVPMIIVVIAGMYLFPRVEFLGGKVEAYMTKEAYVADKYGGGDKLHGSRLVGLPLVLQDLSRNPIMGTALTGENYYEGIGDIQSTHLNSLFTITSTMGFFGLFWWLFFLTKSSKKMGQVFSSPPLSLILIIFLGSFGFNLHTWSILWVFLMYGYFMKHSSIRYPSRLHMGPVVVDQPCRDMPAVICRGQQSRIL